MTQIVRTQLVRWLLLFTAALLGPGLLTGARAQVSITSGVLSVTQNLDALPATGAPAFSQNTTIPGVYGERTGNGTTIVANDGGSNGGNLYSYGTGTATDRALGSLGSGNAAAGNFTYGFRLKNETGVAINSLRIQYTGEQWRTSAAAAQTINFSYLISSAVITTTTSGTALPTGYVAVPALDFTSPITSTPVGALNGNSAENRTTKDVTLTVSIPAGSEIMLRWYDADHAGNDHGLSIDDLIVTATTIAPTLTANPASLTGANGLTYVQGGGPATAPVSVSGTNFTVASGNVTATSSNPAQFTVSPVSTAFTSSSLASTNFTVGLVTGLAVGSTYSANITFEGGGATAVVPVSGTVTAAPVNLSINDVTLAEGNSGPTTFSFTVSLSAPAPAGGVTFDIATADGTATTAGSDYAIRSLTSQTIPVGSSTYTFSVTVNGDATVEPNEEFFVNVTNVTNAVLTDGQGTGTITNDDAAPAGIIRITEYAYAGADPGGEFVELTNVGNAPVDMTNWRFSDSERASSVTAVTPLTAFGTVQPGESVILSESTEADFRKAWFLPATVKVIGGNTVNLGRTDEINIYNASNTLIDRLTYSDQNFPGTVRTQNASAWTAPANLGANTIATWQLSTVGDAQTSYRSTFSNIGNPGGYNVPLPRVLVRETGVNTIITEGGATDTYTVALNTAPTSDVSITITGPGTPVTVSPTPLVFTSANFATPQTVTVSATNDGIGQGNRTVTITQAATSADAAYNGITVNPVSVTVIDGPTANPISISAVNNGPYLSTPTAGPAFVSGVIGNPTDPASTLGVNFSVSAATNITVTAGSSNQAVVPDANLALTGTGASRNLTITPTGVGFATVSVTATNGTASAVYVINYAASAASTSTSRFHTGASDASTAIDAGNGYMFVADDENQVIRLYSRNQSGLPINNFDYNTSLAVSNSSPEVDIESSVKVDSRIYWLGSHSNSANSGAARPNRYRFFATDQNGAGATATLTYAGRYDGLRTDLLAWDASNGHGLGANYLGLTASAQTGVIPEAAGGVGFNIEGLTTSPDNSAAYLAFRAPTEPTTARTNALIVPVTNFAALVSGNPTTGPATFGAPILLDLGGRGIREIKKNAGNEYLIVAGSPSGFSAAPNDFRLYTWTGNPADAPVLRTGDLSTLSGNDSSIESIVELPSPLTPTSSIQFVLDNGDQVYYNNGIIAKDLAQNNWKKSRSDYATLGAALTQTLTANPTTLSNFTALTGTASAPQVYTLTGINLTVSASVSAPAGFEVSTDGTTYATTATVPQTSGVISQTIAVRLASSATPASFSGNVTNVSGSATATVAVSGSVSAPVASGLTPISLTAVGSSYTELFNTLATSGTANSSLPTGFTLTETLEGGRDNELYAADNGASNAGDTYSYGATGQQDRALGGLQSGTLLPVFGATFVNNTGSTVTSLSITYTGEQWRLGTAGRADRLDFQYSLNATSLSNGTFTDVDALDFSSPITTGATGAKDGNAVASQSAVSGNITGLSIPNGATFWIRFNDFNASGADDGLAVDNFSITPNTGGPVTPTLSATPNPLTLSYVVDNGPASRTVTISGSDLTPDVGNVTITSSSTAVTVSFAGSAFGSSATIPYTSSALSGTIAVQLVAGLAAGSYPASLSFTGGSATFNLAVTGTVSASAGSTTRIRDIQGVAHTSPLTGQSVTGVSGIVIAIRPNTATSGAGNGGFYMQDATSDADERTSEGIFVFTRTTPTVSVGDALLVSGTVGEFRPGTGALTISQITNPVSTVQSSANALPAPVILGNGGRAIPATIVEDQTGNVETGGLTFDPATDGIDFYESVEGMRVQINNPVTVSPTATFTSNKEIWVLADNGANAVGTRTERGGILLTLTDANPERIRISDLLLSADLADVPVSTQFSSVTGVVNYSFENFEVLLETLPTVVAPSTLTRETTSLSATTGKLTVGTFNVENLGGNENQAKFDALAQLIANNLKGPDILVLEEVQDNDGATNSATVDATTTYNRLITAITTAGGPAYQFKQVNPADDQDGGEPGGNIRIGFLFNPARVSFTDRGTATATTATTVSNVGGQPQLSFNPGRVDPTNTAFAGVDIGGNPYSASRKPLAGEFVFNGQKVFVIGNHFSSKGPDEPTFGVNQPPALLSEAQRNAQATVVRDFVQQILTVDPNANVIVAGDINDFEFSTPVSILEAAPLATLIETLPLNQRYTYNFQGNAQTLDHVMVSNNLTGNKLDGFDVVHVNSEFADQQSDHDPSIARFNLGPAISATLVASTSVCAGSPASFSLTVAGLVTGATYSYTISNGTNSTTAAGVSSSTVQTSLVPTVAGSFTATVLTSTNASTTAASGNVAINALPTNASLTSGTLTCSATSVTLTASATGGTSYTFSAGAVQIGTTNQAVVSAAGDYSVVISNASGCTASATATVVSNTAAPTNVSLTSGTLTCAQTSVTLTASSTGGTSYTFSGGTPLGSNQVVISTAGTYTVTTSGPNGCTASATATVVSSTAAPTNASLTSGTLTCTNTSVTLTASATGGTSYTLLGGSASQSNTTGQFVVSTAGNYTAVISNADGCTATATATVSNSTATPTASLSANSTTACSPASITLTAGGGTSYTFSAGATQIGNTNQAVVTQSGNYSVTVSNVSGCTATASVSVTVNTPPAAPTLTGVSRTVTQSNTPLPLTQFVNATGSNTLSFSGVNGAIANPPTANISQPGVQSFSVTQTSDAGCISPATPFTITVQAGTTTSPGSQTVCRSSAVVLNATTTGVRYEWYKNGQSAPFKLTEIASIQKGTATSSLTLVSIQTTASYYVKVFQANGTFVFDGPFVVTVNYGCIAPGARAAAAEVAEVPLSVTLTPNPVVNGQLRAVVRGAGSQPLTVKLLDLRGQVVREQSWPEADIEQTVDWSIGTNATGLYLLQAQTPGRLTTVKLIKQ